jgi:hypothetical protein
VYWTLCCKEKDVSYVSDVAVWRLNEAASNPCRDVAAGYFFLFRCCIIFKYSILLEPREESLQPFFKIMFDIISILLYLFLWGVSTNILV